MSVRPWHDPDDYAHERRQSRVDEARDRYETETAAPPASADGAPWRVTEPWEVAS